MDTPSLTKARSEVVDDFIQIEILISNVIADYYLGMKNPISLLFILQVLYDEHCAFALKRSVLGKILHAVFPEKETRRAADTEFQKLYKLNTIRNLFAHCGPDLFVAKDGRGTRIIPDPRKPDEPLDFDAAYQEFKKLQPEVLVWLNGLFPKLPEAREQGIRQFWEKMDSHIPPKEK